MGYKTTTVAYALLACVPLVPMLVPLSPHVHLIALASIIVYVAAHMALAQEGAERIEQKDAMSFPIIAGVALGALFLAFKFLPRDAVNALLTVYFVCVGCVVIGQLLAPLVQQAVPSPAVAVDVTVPLLGHVHLTNAEVVAYAIGAVVAVSYGLSKHWLLNNVLGIAFCLEGIRRISLGTYLTGVLLLCGLFVYDIFMVFGTPLMVTVATSLDGPIKLLFPTGVTDDVTGKARFSLLGLGDIVIPGIFVALLLRHDALQAIKHHSLPSRLPSAADSFAKPVFHAAMGGYVAGLLLTIGVMLRFQAAQPALLYLVPAVIVASLAAGALTARWSELLRYSDDEYVLATGSSSDAPTVPSDQVGRSQDEGSTGSARGHTQRPNVQSRGEHTASGDMSADGSVGEVATATIEQDNETAASSRRRRRHA
jgi:minor histocompatibility antigen H13